MRRAVSIIWIIIFLSTCVHAEEMIDENALFGDPEEVITTGIVDTAPEEEDKKTMGVSGEAQSVFEYTRKKYEETDGDDEISTYIYGNLFFDVRLKKGTKLFADLQTGYDSQLEESAIDLKEIFLDFNVKDRVYLRTGKQVLQWGRCYLWNPSDLINIEKESFTERIGSREGAYGVKMHIPFGTKYNIYSFIDSGNSDESDQLAVAAKFEFLIGKTEMAFSAWNKKGFNPVYAYDLSSRIFRLDIVAEAAFSKGDNNYKIREENGILSKYKVDDEWVSRVCLGIGKSYDFMDVNDRISINMEFYYNQTGYTENIFADTATYAYAESVTVTENGSPVPVTKVRGTKKDFLIDSDLYDMNNISRYYSALFINVSKFIISDMSLNLNLLGNFNDSSYILTTGVSYEDINDFSVGFDIYSYIGNKNREYTFMNNEYTTQLTVGVLF